MTGTTELIARLEHCADKVDRDLAQTLMREAAAALAAQAQEIERLTAWVSDLQSGLYVNCVYCGHRYGPGETTPVSMADALKAHIEQCPKHPMSALKQRAEAAEARLGEATARIETDARLIASLEAEKQQAIWYENAEHSAEKELLEARVRELEVDCAIRLDSLDWYNREHDRLKAELAVAKEPTAAPPGPAASK